MSKIWLFGTYKWQGNPKALFIYMNKYHADRQLWWIAQNPEQATAIRGLGYRAEVLNTDEANALFEKADVYVVENFREDFPACMNPEIAILNLWHGTSLKHVELSIPRSSRVADSITRKYIRNFSLYRNNHLFLTTSPAMEAKYKKQMKLAEHQILRGSYPRNLISQDPSLRTYDSDVIEGHSLSNYEQVILFCPTYRNKDQLGPFLQLIPDLSALASTLKRNNALLILKLHPLMLDDPGYKSAKEIFKDHPHLLFWDDALDIYEIFNRIDMAIVDYSSIYYDLLQAGVDRFIRYIPDYDDYIATNELIHDYFDYTDGAIARSFQDLLDILSAGQLPPIEKRAALLDYFFGYSKGSIEYLSELIDAAESFVPRKTQLPVLYSYDVFDTLIRRKTVLPVSIFHAVADRMRESELSFPPRLLKHYPQIRRNAEADVRDAYRRTQFERGTDALEITFDAIFRRIQENFSLDDAQIRFLMHEEIAAELDAVEAVPEYVESVFQHLEEGNDVVLVSDMYLPEEVVRQLLEKADRRLATLPLYLSSSVGHQKSTGKLFTHIFFDLDYRYRQWIHIGDNKKSDGVEPQRLGITTEVHDADNFIPFEKAIVNALNSYDGYRIAGAMQRYRWNALDKQAMSFDDVAYYAYAYIGAHLVPYVNWVLRDAIRRGYRTLYFISRDGYYLKQIADVIIAEKKYPLNAKMIYGSRPAWRIPSFIDKVDEESFSYFGLFSGLRSFDDLVAASHVSAEELLAMVPALEAFSKAQDLSESDLQVIRDLLKGSHAYRKRLLEISATNRPLVRAYLQQEIDFTEPFAFVEFWARGYLQDALARLLRDAAGKAVTTPCYYVRCLRPDQGDSIRHRYTHFPKAFSFLEPIFSTTPYKSVTEYVRNDEGWLEPVIVRQDNPYTDKISAGIQQFARDFSRFEFADEELTGSELAEASYQYHISHPEDQFICSVFANFNYSIQMHGEETAFAPALPLDLVQTQPLEELHRHTASIEISMARSTEEVRRVYAYRLSEERGIEKKSLAMQRYFPQLPLNRYIRPTKFPFQVMALRNLSIHRSVTPHRDLKSGELSKYEVIEVNEIAWSEKAVPYLKTAKGYVPAGREDVAILRADIDTYLYRDVTRVVAKKPLPFHSSYKMSRETMLSNQIHPGQVIEVLDVEFTRSGKPVLKTASGYLSAKKKDVARYDDYYMEIDHLPMYIYSLKEHILYLDPEITDSSNSENIKQHQIFPVIGSLTNSVGIPMLQTPHGYVPAVRNRIACFENADTFTDLTALRVVAVRTLHAYNSPNLHSKTRIPGKVQSGSVLTVQAVEFSRNGTPALKTSMGYVSARKSDVTPYSEWYFEPQTYPTHVVTRRKQLIYPYPDAEPEANFNTINKHVVLEVIALTHGKSGIPWLKTSHGFLPACRPFLVHVEAMDRYLYSQIDRVVALKKLYFYKTVSFNDANRLPLHTHPGQVLDVQSVEFTSSGVPRLKTAQGYVSAKKLDVAPYAEWYFEPQIFPTHVVTRKKQPIYPSPDAELDANNDVIDKHVVLQVIAITKGATGIPWLKTPQGFLPARRQLLAHVNAMERYLYSQVVRVVALKKLHFYKTVNFNDANRLSQYAKPGQVLNVQSVEFTSSGIPRLKTEQGYVSANRKNISLYSSYLGITFSKICKFLKSSLQN